MARVQSVVCDGCGKVKGDTNHWWKVLVDENPKGPYLALTPLDSNWLSGDWTQIFDLCGQACVISKLSEWMNPKKEAAATPTLVETYNKLNKPGIANATQEAYYIEPRCPRCPHPVDRHKSNKLEATASTCDLCNCQWFPPLDK
jgi:hypothetical protein